MGDGGMGNHPVEEPSARQGKPIGIMVFGVLAIGWGLWFLYWFAARRPWTVYEGIERWSGAPRWLPALALGLLCIISGLALLKLKPWSRLLVLIVTGVIVLGNMQRLIVVGPAMEGPQYLTTFAIAALFIWYFNRKPVKAQLPFRVSLKVPLIIWIVALSLQGAFWLTLWLLMGAHKIPALERTIYEPKPESFYEEGYFRSPFPFRYSLAVPDGFIIRMFNQSDDGGTGIWLMRPDGALLVMSTYTRRDAYFSYLPIMGRICRILGYDDPYRFTRKLFMERYGLLFRTTTLSPFGRTHRLEQARIDGVTAFLNRWDKNVDFEFFAGNEGLGEGQLVGKDPQFGEHGEAIISSIRVQEEPLKSGQEFFDEGMTLVEDGDLEKAKYSFASALCLDWENADYHYQMGRAFADTENWSEARKRLERTLTLESDYAGAQELLEQAKARESETKESEEE
jgi:hypothetical protein